MYILVFLLQKHCQGNPRATGLLRMFPVSVAWSIALMHLTLSDELDPLQLPFCVYTLMLRRGL